MDERALESVGLTRVESKVYLTLLDIGSALAGTITQKSGIQRRSVYDALERLIEKGIVSYIKTNNRKYFQATDPKQLLSIAQTKLDSIASVMPELELKFNLAKDKQETTFFKGKLGLKTVFDDQIREKKEVLILGASTFAYEVVKFYFERYDNQRIKSNIFVRAIFNQQIERKIPKSEIRYLPKENKSHAAINIYGNKVAIILWTESPFAILINNAEVADSYRKYFEFMWDIAKSS